MSRARVARSTPVGGNREIYASYEFFCSEKERGISSAFQKTRPPSAQEGGRSETFRSRIAPLEAHFRRPFPPSCTEGGLKRFSRSEPR